MPLPAPNLYPPFNTVRLSHMVFDVTDLAASEAFWAETLGLVVSERTEDQIFLRAMEER
ncbi:MAG: 3,4-dihydroxyphenylacetate 2,3-dioxygenase, partial [Pseudomonadota bacterium]